MRFERTELLYGKEALKKLADSYVMVGGLGAVGSYATEGLARSGIGKLRLVDFDVVRDSNINRQLYALESTIGKPKAELAEARVRNINPDCDVQGISEFIDDETLVKLLDDKPDLVVDAIDSVGPKLAMIKAVHSRGIPLISSMGAAMRSDPCMVQTGDIAETSFCPLARQIRKRLKRSGIENGIHCVYSTEPIPEDAMIKEGEKWTEEDVMPRGRPRRTLGSSSCITGIFGLTIAQEAVKKLLATLLILIMSSTLVAAEVYTDVDVMALPIGPVEVKEADPVDWFEYGADFRYRIRHEENRWGWEDRRSDRTWARYRTRLWTTLTPIEDLSFNFRLVHEPRYFYRPESREGEVIWEEAIFDHFNVKWKNAFEIPLTVIAGRQDIRFGKGWMITEGTLIDGDRARYFDALRTIWRVEDIKTTVNAIGVYNHAYSSDILPPIHDQEAKLSKSEERGAILYASNKSIEKTKLDSYFIYMHDEYLDNGKGIQGEIYTFGGLVDAKIGENWACYAEVAPQFGRRNGHRMSAFGANSLLSYLLHDKLNSRFNLAYEYASGDDYATKSFSRFWAWGRPWYGQLTNLHKVGLGYVGQLCKDIRLITNYRAFWPDMIPEDRTGVSGEDAMKGQQVDMFIIQTFNKHIRHRIHAGLFFPGDYYEEDKQETHTFARYEITFTL